MNKKMMNYTYCNERYFASIQQNKNKMNIEQMIHIHNYICPVVFRPGGVKNHIINNIHM